MSLQAPSHRHIICAVDQVHSTGEVMARGRKKGVPNRSNHSRFCKMCGRQFFATRADAKTDTSSCRSALRRWVKLFGFEPVEPPGRYRWLDSFEGRRAYRTLRERRS